MILNCANHHVLTCSLSLKFHHILTWSLSYGLESHWSKFHCFVSGEIWGTKKTACQILLKTNNFYPLIRTRIYVYQGVRNVPFLKIWRPFFLVSSVLRFNLLPCYLSVSSRSCDMFRQHDGLRALCRHFKDSKDQNVLHKTTELFRIVLSYWR